MGLDDILPYLTSRPPLEFDQREESAYHDCLGQLQEARGPVLLGSKDLEPWKLLCRLGDSGQYLLHGTSDPSIIEFEPRRSNDTNPFGAQEAVYASSDGLWAMFYAILDRSQGRFSLHNGAFDLVSSDGSIGATKYFLSIERGALARQAFSDGYVFVLPSTTFEQDPISLVAGQKIRIHHWASLQPVRPLGVVKVSPRQFPLLADIRSHDDSKLWKRMEADPDRFPWVDEQYSEESLPKR